MTVAAPRSGRGKLTLVLIAFAALVAVGFALVSVFQARAANHEPDVGDLVSVPDPDHWNVIGSDHYLCVVDVADADADVTVVRVRMTEQNGANAAWTGNVTKDVDMVGDTNIDDLCVSIRSTQPGETVQATIEYLDDSVLVSAAGFFIKEWSELTDSVIITGDGSGSAKNLNSIGWQHDNDVQDTVLSRSVGSHVDLLAIAHGEHQTEGSDPDPGGIPGFVAGPGGLVHVDVDHAAVDVQLVSPRGCTTYEVSNQGFTGRVGNLAHGGVLITLWNDCAEVVSVWINETYPNPVASAVEDIEQHIVIEFGEGQSAKQPQFRWKGEDIVLAKQWPSSECSVTQGGEGSLHFFASQFVRLPSSTATGGLITGLNDDVQMDLDLGPLVIDAAGLIDILHVVENDSPPNNVWALVDPDTCVSKALATSEEGGEGDFEAILYNFSVELSITESSVEAITEINRTVVDQHGFNVLWLQLEDINLHILPGDGGHTNDYQSDGTAEDFDVDSDYDAGDPTSGETSDEGVLWADQLLRANVRGWVVMSTKCNNDQRAVDHDNNDATVEILYPQGRCIMPDDFVAVFGALPLSVGDVLYGPGDDIDCGTTDDDDDEDCGLIGELVGPKHTLDDPHICPESFSSEDDPPGSTVCPSGEINIYDMLMPPLQIHWDLSGAGFFKPILKHEIDQFNNGEKPYYSILVPADPEIPSSVNNGGYLWDTFGWIGDPDGEYDFYLPLPGSDQGSRALDLITYSDNSGQSFVVLNRDYNLDYSGCDTDTLRGSPVCDVGDLVGTTNAWVTGDYPYFRGKNPPVQSNTITKTGIWAGYKRVTVEPVANDPNHTYVVTHLLDRDGECDGKWDGNDPLNHYVHLEPVDFGISGDGVIINAAVDVIILGIPFSRATALAGDADDHGGDLPFADAGEADECQAWILVEHGVDADVQVSIRFHEPEGVITKSVQFPQEEVIWGDVDNDGDVDAVDGLKVLQFVAGLSVSTDPSIGSTITLVDGSDLEEVIWGDVDNDGDVDAVDALQILGYVAAGTSDTDPAIGETVTIL